MQTQLEGMDASITQVEKAIETMKTLGMDTRDIEEKLTWSKEVRETLLKQFGQ